MNGGNWLWLALGLGLGLGLGSGWSWIRDRNSRTSKSEFVESEFVKSEFVKSESVKSESELRDRLHQLELDYRRRTEMEQFKGGFLARTSHELRSPLNGLIGMQQLILSDLCDSPEEEREFLAQAHDSALKMVKILDTLIDVSKTEAGSSPLQIQPVSLAQILHEVQTVTHLPAKNRNLHLHIHCPDEDLYVLADPRCLRQVLVNLVDSAIVQTQEGTITLSLQVESGYAHLWLADDRPAQAWSEPHNLLTVETSADAPVPSCGLTLLANQTLLQLMQGRLELVPTQADGDSYRVQCSIPIVELEEF